MTTPKTTFDPRRGALTDAQRAVLAEDRKRMTKLGKGGQLDEWLAFGPGLMIRRELAQDIAGTQDLKSIKYKRAFKAQMEVDGLYDATTTNNTMKAIFTAVLFFHEELAQRRLDVLAEIRRDMTDGERARLNSPITARQKVEKVLRERGLMEAAKPRAKTAPKAAIDPDSEVDQLKARNNELTEELQNARSAQPAHEGIVDDESTFVDPLEGKPVDAQVALPQERTRDPYSSSA
jgi:hypothetical protein